MAYYSIECLPYYLPSSITVFFIGIWAFSFHLRYSRHLCTYSASSISNISHVYRGGGYCWVRGFFDILPGSRQDIGTFEEFFDPINTSTTVCQRQERSREGIFHLLAWLEKRRLATFPSDTLHTGRSATIVCWRQFRIQQPGRSGRPTSI